MLVVLDVIFHTSFQKQESHEEYGVICPSHISFSFITSTFRDIIDGELVFSQIQLPEKISEEVCKISSSEQ